MLSWNPWTIRHLKEMRKIHFPDPLFLMETKNSEDFLLKVFGWLGYDHFRTVEPDGLSGCLAIFWKNILDIEILFADKNLIDLKISNASKIWFVSCVYGNPVAHLRPLVWERISRIGILRKEAWCMIGDFNEILSNYEKLGGPLRVDSSFQSFKNFLAICDMYELGSSGNGFTWGGIRNKQWIQCKLDCCFGNPAWFSMFPTAHQWFLEKLGSDHKPVLVEFTEYKEFFRSQFRFDKRWAEDPSFLRMLTQAWNKDSAGTSSDFLLKAEQCKKAIQVWKKNCWSNSDWKLED